MAGPTPTIQQRPPAPRRSPAAVRVVLFGAPYAGKTSLLGALVQAIEKQTPLLHLHIRDIPPVLREIRRQVYEEAPRETREEVVPYTFRVDPPGSRPPFPAVIYDCDGRVANELLTHWLPADDRQRSSRLAQAILDADALILVVDASSSSEQLDAEFKEFRRFLKLLEGRRTEGREVGGLPVFLVLTKCDRLAELKMTPEEWDHAVAERKRSVARRFKEFMGDAVDPADPFLSFGSLDLEVAGTAIRKPDLRHAPGGPHEPVGVAELFRQCLEAGRRYRDRAVRGHKRLLWTVAGALGFLVVAMIAALAFAFFAPQQHSGLLVRIERYEGREGPDAASRLAAKAGLDKRLEELFSFKADSGWDELPKDKKDFVEGRIAELRAYLALSEELRKVTRPNAVRSLEDLKKIEDALKTQVTPPQPYVLEWANTEAARFRDRLLEEVASLRHAVGDVRAFYQNLNTRGTTLLFTKELDADWAESVRTLFKDETAPAVPVADSLKRLAYDFDDAQPQIREWVKLRGRLQFLHDLAGALGLVGDPARAPLVLADLSPEADVNLWARDKLLALRKAYPDYDTWSLDPVPETIRPLIEARVRRSLTEAERAGQRLVLTLLHASNATGPEQASDWPIVADRLLMPPTQPYRELVTFLARLLDPNAKDPVLGLAEFLRQKSFDIDLRSIRVRIPDNLRDGRLRPDGPLTVQYIPAGGTGTMILTYDKVEDKKPADAVEAIDYTFKLQAGDSKLVFRPGDDFWVELKLREGDRPWQFTWWRWSTKSYRFEALKREPRLHTPGDFNAGYFVDGVRLTIADGKAPEVPALLPTVRFDKK